MPGALPVARRRRLAPVPCLLRSKATNFMTHSSSGTAAATSVKPRFEWPPCEGPAKDSEQVLLLREQTHHRLALGDALDRLGDQRRHGNLADLRARARAVHERDRIGDHHF